MKSQQQWRKCIEEGGLDQEFRRAIGMLATDEEMDCAKKRLNGVLKHFHDIFGEADVACFTAPGRTEVIGNHTDHQYGQVLAASVNLDVYAVAGYNDEDVIRFQSEGWPMVTVELDRLSMSVNEKGTTQALLRGVASAMLARGANPRGLDIYAQSDVLPGSGLSSSAAIEVLLALICNTLWDGVDLDPVEWAKIGQYAENEYFGKPSGLMDQTACAVGQVVHIDFGNPTSPKVEKLALDLDREGYALCIVDTGADHADLTDAYAAIPEEMQEVARAMDEQRDHLGQFTQEEFASLRLEVISQVSHRAYLRALHFFSENHRVETAVSAIKSGNFPLFLEQVQNSGLSSFTYLQNIYPSGAVQHQEMALALGLTEAFFREHKGSDKRAAWRVHGGGFAGTIQVFVPLELVSDFVAYCDQVFSPGACHVLHMRPSGAFAWKGESA